MTWGEAKGTGPSKQSVHAQLKPTEARKALASLPPQLTERIQWWSLT